MALHIHIDPVGGIAGDMFLGAILDLGVDMAALEQYLVRAGMEGRFHLSKQQVLRHGIGATDLKVHTDIPPQPHPLKLHSSAHVPAPLSPAGQNHGHRHVRRSDILAIADRIDLPQRARDRAGRIVNLLAEAEGMVHRMSPDEVHFHEVGAVDSIVDMLGAAVGLEMLGVETLTCGPLPLGRGFVHCAHGHMPLPAPATAYLLRGMATVGVDRTVETVTPTGAAIVAALAQPVTAAPPMKLQAVGYGAGDRDDADTPNLVRLFLGASDDPPRDEHTAVIQLLVLALAMGIFMHQEDPALFHPWALDPMPWLELVVLAKLGLALLYAGVSWAALGQLSRNWVGTQRRMERFNELYRLAVLLLYALDLRAGVYDALRQATGNLFLVADILFMLPPLALVVWSWWCYYPIERRLCGEIAISRVYMTGKPPAIWTRRQYLTAQFRHQIAFILAPVLVLLGWQELVDGLAAHVTWLSAAMATGITFAGAGCVFLFTPVMIRRIWDTTPLPAGATRELLTGLCTQYKVRFRELLLWRTFGSMVNAAVMGFLAPFRYILLTDALLDNTSPEQVEAVMAHELAHVRKHHIIWLMVAAGVLLMTLILAWSAALTRAAQVWSMSDWEHPHWLIQSLDWLLNPENTGTIAAGGTIICWGLAWTWVSRRFERQADAYAVQHLARRTVPAGEEAPRIDAQSVATMVGTLQQVADLNYMGVTRRSWRHGSILWRQRYLQTLIGRPIDRLPIDRCVFWIKMAVVVGLVVVVALNIWTPAWLE